MRATTAIKTQIIEAYPQFQAVPKKADVVATAGGKEVRVTIKKGEAKAIKVDGKKVWTGEGDVLEALSNLYPQPKQPKQTASRVKVTDEWIQTITLAANESAELKEGHSIRLRVATSHGKPVTAAIDIYEGEEKIATGGRQKKVGFAASGITDQWKAKVDAAVVFAYSKVKKA